MKHAIAAMLVLIGFALIATACNEQTKTYAVRTAAISADLLRLDTALDGVGQIDTGQITDDERALLDQAADDLRGIRGAVHAHISASGGLGKFIIAASEAKALHLKARSAYLAARDVINRNWDGFNPADQQRLRDIDRIATRADDNLSQAFTVVVDGQDITPLLSDLLVIAAQVARVAK